MTGGPAAVVCIVAMGAMLGVFIYYVTEVAHLLSRVARLRAAGSRKPGRIARYLNAIILVILAPVSAVAMAFSAAAHPDRLVANRTWQVVHALVAYTAVQVAIVLVWLIVRQAYAT